MGNTSPSYKCLHSVHSSLQFFESDLLLALFSMLVLLCGTVNTRGNSVAFARQSAPATTDRTDKKTATKPNHGNGIAFCVGFLQSQKCDMRLHMLCRGQLFACELQKFQRWPTLSVLGLLLAPASIDGWNALNERTTSPIQPTAKEIAHAR